MMLHLASQSPRRRELLARLGLDFGTLDLDIPEHCLPGEPALDYVKRVAREKAGAGLLQVMTIPDAVVLGADTEVVVDGEVFGKPSDDADAERMLQALAGRTHQVISAMALVSADRELQAVSLSEVTFMPLSGAQIRRYVASGEPRGRAGGYAIQGAAQLFVSHLSGSYSGVMGLPLFETAQLLRDFGIAVPLLDSTPAALPSQPAMQRSA